MREKGDVDEREENWIGGDGGGRERSEEMERKIWGGIEGIETHIEVVEGER